jgi:UrcA family protein
MTVPFRAAAAALALSCLSIPPSAGARPIPHDRTPVSVRVPFAGLDLSTADGRAAFGARVRRAASTACGMRTMTLGDRIDAHRCMREMLADAEVQVAARYGPRERQLASVRR